MEEPNYLLHLCKLPQTYSTFFLISNTGMRHADMHTDLKKQAYNFCSTYKKILVTYVLFYTL